MIATFVMQDFRSSQ